MVILYQKDQGLGQGIGMLGQALGQGLQQRAQAQQKLALQQAQNQRQLQQQIALDEAKGQRKFQTDLALLMAKDQLKNQSYQDLMSQWGQRGEPQQDQSPLLSRPSEEISLEDKLTNMPSPDAPPSERLSVNTPNGPVSRLEIDRLLAHPEQNIRELGKSLDQQWLEKYKQDSKEKREVRKEYRNEIRKYSEPYQDISKIRVGLNKLKKAEELIKSGKVSIDENWWRNSVAAILEGSDKPLADLVKTPEQQQLWYLLRDSLKTKEIGGSNPSTKEVLLALSAQPGPYKGQQANEFIIGNMIENSMLELNKANTIKDLRQKEDKLTFPEFLSQVEDETSKYMDKREKIGKAKSIIGDNRPPEGFSFLITDKDEIKQVPNDRVDEQIKEKGWIKIEF